MNAELMEILEQNPRYAAAYNEKYQKYCALEKKIWED